MTISTARNKRVSSTSHSTAREVSQRFASDAQSESGPITSNNAAPIKRAPTDLSVNVYSIAPLDVPITPRQWLEWLTSEYPDTERVQLLAAYEQVLANAASKFGINVIEISDVRTALTADVKTPYTYDGGWRAYAFYPRDLISHIGTDNDRLVYLTNAGTARGYISRWNASYTDEPERASWSTQAGHGMLAVASPLASVGYEFINRYIKPDLFLFTQLKSAGDQQYLASPYAFDNYIIHDANKQPLKYLEWPAQINIADVTIQRLESEFFKNSKPKIPIARQDPKADTAHIDEVDQFISTTDSPSLRRFSLLDSVIPVASQISFEDVGFTPESEDEGSSNDFDAAVGDVDISVPISVYDDASMDAIYHDSRLRPETKKLFQQVIPILRAYPSAKFVISAGFKDSTTHKLGLAYDVSSELVLSHRYNPLFMYKADMLAWIKKLFNNISGIFFIEDNHWHIMPRTDDTFRLIKSSPASFVYDNGKLAIYTTKPVKHNYYMISRSDTSEAERLSNNKFFSLSASEIARLPSRQI